MTDAYYFTGKGGDFYQVTVGADGTLLTQRVLHLSNGSAASYSVPASASTPVIYKGRAYIGVCGSSVFGAYTGHNITVIDLASWTIAYTVPTQGYPQTSGLLTTAYEGGTEYVYVYFIENYLPGKVRVIRDKAGQREMDHTYSSIETMTSGGVTKTYETGYLLFTPSGAQAQFAINSPITDSDGNLYFKNDSAYLMCLSNVIVSLEIVQEPDCTEYCVGQIFDGTGMQVVAHYANGTTKDISDYLMYTGEPLTEDDTEIGIGYDLSKTLSSTQSYYMLYQNADGESGVQYYIPFVYQDITLHTEHIPQEPVIENETVLDNIREYDSVVYCGHCGQELSRTHMQEGIEQSVIILVQPADVSGKIGQTVSYTVEAENVASWQWYYTKDSGKSWYKSNGTGASTDTLSLKVTNTNKTNKYRCKLTGLDGKVVYTETAGLLPGLSIDKQPVSAEAAVGETATFTVQASLVAEGGYQWYYSKDNGVSWYKSSAAGAKTNTLSVTLKTSNITMLYRCKLTGEDGSVLYTNRVRFLVPPVIKTQPAPCAAPIGTTASYSVLAENVESYQWYYSKNGGANWYKSTAEGNTTDTISFTAKASTRATIYRCKLTSPTGQVVYTGPAGFVEGLTITEQPVSIAASAGGTVQFHVTANHAAGYQWYYSKDGAKWYKSSASGCTTDTITLTVTNSNITNIYRCKVTGEDGTTQYTESAGVI